MMDQRIALKILCAISSILSELVLTVMALLNHPHHKSEKETIHFPRKDQTAQE